MLSNTFTFEKVPYITSRPTSREDLSTPQLYALVKYFSDKDAEMILRRRGVFV